MIVAPARFEAILDEYIRQVDFRQAAMYDCAPFRIDSQKRSFYLSRLERGLLHVTALKVGGAIASLNLGQKDKNSIQIGIAHSPLFAAYSIGKFHIYLLCLLLAKEGIVNFDLTPGGGYKMRFSTDTEDVFELNAYFSLYGYGKKQVVIHARRLAERVLQALDVSSTSARLHIGKWKKSLRMEVGPWLRSCREMKCYVYQGDFGATTFDPAASFAGANRLDELLLYDETVSEQTYQAFQYEAMRCLESGQRVYTRTEGNCLTYAVWVITSHDPELHSEKWQAHLVPKNAIVMHDIYRQPKADSGHAYCRLLEHILHDLRCRHHVGPIHFLVPADDRITRAHIDQKMVSGPASPTADRTPIQT